MREPEFLPAWYPRLRRRKRIVALQGWTTLGIVLFLGIWTVFARYNVVVARANLQTLGGQMAETQAELTRLDNLLSLQKQLQQQNQVLAQLGLHVESSRMLAQLKSSMPPEMSLLEATLLIEEKPVVVSSLTAAAKLAGTNPKSSKGPDMERNLRVKLLGVAPSDVDVATFLAKLQSTTYFNQVAMSYARDRADNGYLMREFEVTFAISLTGDTADERP